MVGVGDVGGGHNLAVGEKSAAKITHLYENGGHGRDAPRASVKNVETRHGTSLQWHITRSMSATCNLFASGWMTPSCREAGRIPIIIQQ